MSQGSSHDSEIDKAALIYHRMDPPGKLQIVATKPMANQRDLALAYSPGVAAACMLVHEDPLEAANMTARGNLVGVITNGTAVLGLGNIGALAAKPVMEGKAVLFKQFADIDVFDIDNFRVFGFSPESGGLLFHPRGQFLALDAVGKTGIVLNFVGDQQLAAGTQLLQQHRLQHCPGGVKAGSQSRRAGP